MDAERNSNAIFSPCRKYRYALWRKWDGLFATYKYVNFICLNPSTADETKDDNTIRKCMKFAKSWGYDGLCVTNLFAWRSTDWKALLHVDDPIGEDNDAYLEAIAGDAALVVAAWSQYGGIKGRSAEVREMIEQPMHYLRLGTINKEPYHPLYLPATTKPILWSE